MRRMQASNGLDKKFFAMFKLQQVCRWFGPLALLTALFAAPAAAEQQTFAPGSAVTIAIEDEYYPFSYKSDRDDPNSERLGFDAGFAKLLCHEMDWQCTLSPLPFAEIIPAVQSGKADLAVAGLTPSPEREQTLAFTRSYYRSRSIFIGRSGQQAEPLSPEVSGLKIGTQSGSAQAAALKNFYSGHNEIVLYANYADLFSELSAGRLDVILVDGLAGYHYLKSELGSTLELLGMFSEQPMPMDDSCVVLSKEHAAALPLLNAAISKLLISAEYELLSLEYFPFINY